jgi:MFS family permease
VLGDCWKAEERGLAIGVYSLAPLLGPAIGPIIGGFITEHTTWRWTFWMTSMLDFVIQICGLFLLRETYAPRILSRKAAHLRATTGEKAFHTEFEASQLSVTAKLKVSLLRPIRMLATQPIIQILAIYMAFLYGMVYLILATFSTLWTQVYGERTSIGSLHYITLALGCFAGSQFGAIFSDRIYKHYTSMAQGNIGQAEFRVPLIFLGACLVPAGLFVYGWTAEYRVFWLVPDIGAFVFSAGTIMCFQCIQM